MALSKTIPLGMALPHRSPDPIAIDTVRAVAQRAEALGFRDLWVTENTLDHVISFDPVVILTFAAAVTRRIRLGASVIVLPVHDPRLAAHQWASLDRISEGRAILGVGQGRPDNFHQFDVPMAGRVRRFAEQIAVIRALWSEPEVRYEGQFVRIAGATMPLKPVQRPLPIWTGVGHPDALRRTATLADGWMGAGGSTTADFARSVPLLRAALERAGRDPAHFPISKRVFLAVDERADRARALLARWYGEVYHNPAGTETSGVYGTPEQVREKLEAIAALGANHLLLNPVGAYAEQLEAVAAAVGLSAA
jgi:probable F420-dependent oxidoreductase